MNKAELVADIAAKNDLSKVAAAAVLDGLIETITAVLVDGDKLTVPGFGTFSTGTRAARVGRNPQTGAEIKIAASNVVKFSAGSTLKEAVNKPKKKKK